MCFLELSESNCKGIQLQLLCWVVILLPEKNKQKLDVSSEGPSLKQFHIGTTHTGTATDSFNTITSLPAWIEPAALQFYYCSPLT
jgi:hypothetical protein